MAQIPGFEDGFPAEEITPSGSFDPVPRGKYVAQIVESELKTTKKGDGQYISLRFKIIEGDYEGRNVFAQLNMVNPSVEAQRIARQQFSSICHATGVLNPSDTTELHGIPMIINVKIRPGTDVYPPTNDILGYEELSEEAGAAAPW